MRQSKLFIKTSKTVSVDEVSKNAQLLIRAGFVDKLMAGAYTLLPFGFKVYKKIEQIIREEMNQVDGEEIIMPALHPKENWEKTGRWNNFDALIYLGLSDKEKNMALGPTHEEIVVPLAKRFINSYKDLPRYVYQFQDKFRNEKRAKSGLLRGREFVMKDLYSFHVDQADLENYYERVKTAYTNIFSRCGLGDVTYMTYASGGAFSKFSHEYQTLTSAGEDLIYICDKCRVAVNKEILEEIGNKCPQCSSTSLHEEKAVEVGNIFQLGTRFSEPFDLNYVDSQGTKKPVIMGCYGIGLQRLIGTIAEVKSDDRGLVWPEEVAPFIVHLVELNSENKEVKSKAVELYEKLKNNSIDVLYDDREGVTPGEKFADSDLIGCPYRLVISDRTIKEDSAEFKRRIESEIQMIKLDQVIEMFKK